MRSFKRQADGDSAPASIAASYDTLWRKHKYLWSILIKNKQSLFFERLSIASGALEQASFDGTDDELTGSPIIGPVARPRTLQLIQGSHDAHRGLALLSGSPVGGENLDGAGPPQALAAEQHRAGPAVAKR